MRRAATILAALAVAVAALAQPQCPKREMRGAWIPTVGDRYFAAHNAEENQAYLLEMLDSLQAVHCNAVMFHCRPQADAFYPSQLEPWSKWVTGTPGQAPDPMWDPMDFMVRECHKRGMELHAWINPYRVGYDSQIADSALARTHPQWFVRYADQTYFDPAYPEVRQHIFNVVADIVRRYDVDAIHMDDFFYPYPKGNRQFPDTASYRLLGGGMDRGDWRRANVDSLIEGMHRTIVAVKPWVRFGISPFGIWRNKKNDPRGSDTNGLECYDDLYADPLNWTRHGWIDYLVPQLYWAMDYRKASDRVLMQWWNQNTNGRHMYYGLDVRNTMQVADSRNRANRTQLDEKLTTLRALPNVQGVVWWPCSDIVGNYRHVADSLRTSQQRTLALPPAYPWIDDKAPGEVQQLSARTYPDMTIVSWQPPKTDDPMQQAGLFVVYAFAQGEKVDLERSEAIRGITSNHFLAFHTGELTGEWTIVVTALNRCNNESKHGTALKVKF